MGIFGIHPAVFVRVASKGLTGYVTWKSAQRIENKGFANSLFARESEMKSKNGGCGIRRDATPPGICKDVKGKKLRKGAFVRWGFCGI
jgi:hypothetical protein